MVDGLAEPRVGGSAGERGGDAEVVETAEHVVVPSVWVQEVEESLVGRLTGAPPAEQPSFQEILFRCLTRRPGPRGATGGPLVFQSPSSTLIVVPNDERLEPLMVSQFQPPSSRRSPTSRSTIGEMSTPK